MISSHKADTSNAPDTRVRANSKRRYLRLGALAAAASLMLTGCDVEDSLRFGWPRGITPQAEEMRQLWTWSVVAALVVGVFVWGLIFWCIGAYRKRGEELPPQTRYNMPIEILYSAVPFFIISVLFYYTAIAQTYVDKETKNPDVTVTVVAFKWNWRFEYPDTKGADGEEISTLGSTDEIPILVLPTDKTIRFDEISEDVIHSFWVPDLLFKRDVIPGHPNSFQITIEREGAYVGRCAELCGTYHANMNFELRAVSWADYQRYLESRSQGLSMSEALEAIGQPGHATTTEPFNPERTKRSAS